MQGMLAIAVLTGLTISSLPVGAGEISTKPNQNENFIGGYIELDITHVDSVHNGDSELQLLKGDLPSYYITPNLPEIKNQNPYGTCWAFSTAAMAEINMRKKGIRPTADFSELQIVYFSYNNNGEADPLGNNGNDFMAFAGEDILQKGGNYELSTGALEAWRCPAEETLLPYNEDSANKVLQGLDSSYAYQNKGSYVENVHCINTSDWDVMKQMIMECGSVGISYYYNGVYESQDGKSYYCPTPLTTNHAVTIVGWDDNYGAGNFVSAGNSTQPSGNGAWIVRNSWGENWGDKGYFYMSYYDQSLWKTSYAIEMNDDLSLTHNYQYDATWVKGALNCSTAANVFQVKGNPQGEVLKSISYYTPDVNRNYEVKVYRNLTNGADPTSGTLVATVSGSNMTAGYHNVEISPVDLQYGDTFSVVVTLSGEGTTRFGTDYASYNIDNWFVCQGSAQPGQSFIYRNSWIDTTTASMPYNMAIKAYTADANPVFGWKEEGGFFYWYEGGVRQGTYEDANGVMGDNSIRGREIYDPGSNGWYWLDSCYNGAKALTKEVWIPYVYQGEQNWSEEEIRQNAQNSGDMAELVYNTIKSRIGKWVRYDSQGAMYKGWYTVQGADEYVYPAQAGKTYYYDPITGLMAKGSVKVGDVVYYFNEITGELQR